MKVPPLTPVTLTLNWLALLVLTGLTTAIAFVDLGAFNLVVAIVIACIKATLIVAIFMHMVKAFTLVRLVALSGLVWFFIMLSLTFGDYISRNWAAK